MKFVTILVAIIFALGVSVSAQGRGNGQAKKMAAPGPKAKSPAQSTKPAAKAQARAVKAEARAAKTTAKVETRAAKTTAKAEKRAVKVETKAAKTETKAARVNPQQEARLLALLPPGSTIQGASQGFKNWGQFVAAVNASTHNSIPFVDLKARMTGIAPGSTVRTAPPMSLGQAVKSFRGTTTPPHP